jgi:dihydrolipoamide dehydrogenase
VGVRETGARLSADHIVIATGSRPVLPPIPGMDLPGVMDSAGALALTQLPASVLILGGGVIGVEFAQIFSRFGVTVTLVEQQERMLVQEDPELVEVLQRQLAADTVQCHFNVSIVRVEQMGTQLVATLADGRRLAAEKVLVATGRRPCTEGLGLDRIGLQLDAGAIVTNEHGQTSIAHIYAVGDVQGGQLLAHKATAQAEAAVAHLRGHGRGTAGLAIANAVYTSPEIASVGLSEAQARQRHATVKVGRFPFNANGRALAMKSGQGFVKVIADADTDQILGISMVGPEVTQLLGEATLAVQMELTLSALMETVHAHPTLSEALMEASNDAFNGGAIHLPPRPT